MEPSKWINTHKTIMEEISYIGNGLSEWYEENKDRIAGAWTASGRANYINWELLGKMTGFRIEKTEDTAEPEIDTSGIREFLDGIEVV